MKYLTTAILVAAIAIPVRAEEPRKVEAEKPVKVPFTLVATGHFIVTVKLNDKGPYKLIFDTGAPMMLITNRIALESGVLEKKGGTGFSLFGPMAQGKIKKLEIGPLKSENVNAMVFDHPTVKTFSEFFKKDHGEIDGIVGFPFFARYRMTVDYQAKELTFVPNGYEPQDVMQAMLNMLLNPSPDKNKPKIVAAAGQWGIIVEKGMKDEDAGVTIKTVMDGSAAAKAGLKAGDRLLTIDGRWTDSVGDAYQAAGYVKPGKSAPVVIRRDGKEMKLTVTPTSGL